MSEENDFKVKMRDVTSQLKYLGSIIQNDERLVRMHTKDASGWLKLKIIYDHKMSTKLERSFMGQLWH